MLQRFTSLPILGRVALTAIPIVLILVIAFITLTKGPGKTIVGESTNQTQINDWQQKLGAANVPYTVEYLSNGNMAVETPSPDATDARNAMFIDIKPTVDTTKQCPKPSMFDTTGADQYQTCLNQAKMHDMLVNRPDIMSALVKLTEFQNDDFTSASGQSAMFAATITPTPGATLNGKNLATQIAEMDDGLTTSNISLMEVKGNKTHMLWPQPKNTTQSSCSSVETSDIFARQQAIEGCLQEQITSQIMDMNQQIHATVSSVVTLSPSASSQTVHSLLDGVKTEINNSKSPGSEQSNVSASPSTKDVSTSTMAGYIQKQSVSVILANGTKGQIRAVKQLLAPYQDPKAGFTLNVQAATVHVPAPSATAQSSGANGAPSGKATTSSRSTKDLPDGIPHDNTPKGAIPHWLLIGGLLVVAALASVIFFLWRRTVRLTAERKVFEGEFRNDMHQFQGMDADYLTRELEQMLGDQSSRDQANR